MVRNMFDKLSHNIEVFFLYILLFFTGFFIIYF
jgi:hypothetical protein